MLILSFWCGKTLPRLVQTKFSNWHPLPLHHHLQPRMAENWWCIRPSSELCLFRRSGTGKLGLILFGQNFQISTLCHYITISCRIIPSFKRARPRACFTIWRLIISKWIQVANIEILEIPICIGRSITYPLSLIL